jgi:hypothetical protein
MAKEREQGNPGDIVLPGSRKREPVVGRRLIRMLEDQLACLHAQPVHGNRTLFADHILVAHLIVFFNPAIASLRTIEDVFEHDQVRRRMRLPRVPKSTLSDAQRVFDLTLLQPLVDDLVGRLDKLPHDSGLDVVTRRITAVDACVFDVAARIAWALPRNTHSARGAVQWCLHFDVLHGAPDGFTLIGGQESERTQLPQSLAPNRLYLLDRAYQSYAHLDRIAEMDSDFVVRLRRTARFVAREHRPLSAEDRRAGVRSDSVVTPADRHHRFAVPMRLVELTAPEGGEPVRLLTNRLDLPAALIGLLYRHRWQIELFFRWIKCVTHLKHFFSESPTGMALQLYVAMIGTLLIALETGTRPSKYDFAQMTLVASGMVTLEEAKVVMARRRAERARAAARQAEYRAAKKAGH